MLTRQLASAGSGKTFTLARQYIRFLISIQEENHPRRLRKGRELADAASHILAITFTNKATSEMKDRIVSKLAALANANGNMKVDYMADFTKEFKATPSEISEVCKIALDHLLNDFSKFNVTTIDSFFQSVLRTFAYETELNDNYGVEIGTDTLSALAIESMFNGVNSNTGDIADTEPVLSLLMDINRSKNRSGWNLFQRRESGQSAYADLLKSLGNLDNDEFRKSYGKLEKFFFSDEGLPLTQFYHELKKRSEAPLNDAWQKVNRAALRLKDAFLTNGIDIVSEGRAHMHTHVRLGCTPDWEDVISEVAKKKTPDSDDIKTFFASKHAKRLSSDSFVNDEITEAGREFYDAINHFKFLTENPDGAYFNWNLYKENLPLLGMLLLVNRQIRSYTADHNLVQLGDTNSILSTIIAEDDTPFIYERLGSRLDHFLIDEFQDTSRMQWDNLLPLLNESESRNKENLIIGDAKQSIYRFRNADSSIITEDVPSLFSGRMRDAGNSPKENTNWRSDRKIVEFNNILFHYLSNSLGEQFARLYGNCVQPPHHQEPRGYVEITFDSPTGAEQEAEEGDEPGNTIYSHLHLGEMVKELRERGYRFRDIAFLVRTNTQGEEVINTLIEYNSKLGHEDEKIQFVSEDSLKIESSMGVRIITDALRSIITGTPFRIPDFPSVALLNTEESDQHEVDLESLLKSMQSTALTALVEAIAEKCVAPRIRKDEAAFLAAFQDEVTTYCDSHPTDIASFLSWWDERKKKASITSPEDTDAVQVMTIHKSKGLEFKCVIIPELEADFGTSSDKKWTWVKPVNVWGDDMPMPDILPICISSKLTGSRYEHLLTQFMMQNAVDNLNTVYVALTRAVNELYIFLPLSGRASIEKPQTTKLWGKLLEFLNDNAEIFNEVPEQLKPYIPPAEEFTKISDYKFSFGTKEDNITVTDGSSEDSSKALPITNYHINSSLPILQFHETDETANTSATGNAEVREEGTVYHTVLSYVIKEGDLEKAFIKCKATGIITNSWIEANRDFLTKAIESVHDRGWFAANQRVLTERSIARITGDDRKIKVRRPDRVMINADGDAVIVDYKFGEEDKSYRRQIRDYVAILSRCSGIRSVEGYLWYVSKGVIEKC